MPKMKENIETQDTEKSLDDNIEASLQRQSDTYSSRLDEQHPDIWIIAAKTSIDSNLQNRLITFIGAKFLERFFNTWQNIKSSRLWNLQDDYFQMLCWRERFLTIVPLKKTKFNYQ
jgi:hypothetical protein